MSALRESAQRYLIPDATPLSPAERWRSTLAALLGMLLIQGILAVLPAQPGISYLLAPGRFTNNQLRNEKPCLILSLFYPRSKQESLAPLSKNNALFPIPIH